MEAFANAAEPESAPFIVNAGGSERHLGSGTCLALWRSLLHGQRRIAGCVTTATRAFVVMREGAWQPQISARGLDILERVLLGATPKSVAIELGISASTVATSLKSSMEQIGLRCRPARVPLGLAMLVRVAYDRASLPLALASGSLRGGEPCQVLSGSFASLDHLLPPAVLDVVHLQTRGCSHSEIASRRHVSTRTVANQLAFAFRSLGVSGRSGLLDYFLAQPPVPQSLKLRTESLSSL